MNLLGLVLQFLFLGLLLVASGFFSGSETALFSLSPLRIRKLELRHPHSGRKVHDLLQNPSRLLISILIGNMFVNILASALADDLSASLLRPPYDQWMSIGIMTCLILIIGEITPKIIASRRAEWVARTVAPVLQVLETGVFPLQWVLHFLSEKLLRLVSSHGGRSHAFTPEEFLTAVRIGKSEGVLDPEEEKMIGSVVRLSRVTALELMKPRSEMVALEIEDSYEEILGLIQAKRYSRIPVYRGSPDEIVGILYVKDFMHVSPEQWTEGTLEELLRDPYFVPETQTARDLFRDLRAKRLHLAIVVDEYGGVSGLVTLDDLLEEIVGDIVKIGTDEPEIQRLGIGRALVRASISLDKFNESFYTRFEDDEVVSLGGYLTHRLGRIPVAGEIIQTSLADFTILRASPNRLEEVLVQLNPVSGKEEP